MVFGGTLNLALSIYLAACNRCKIAHITFNMYTHCLRKRRKNIHFIWVDEKGQAVFIIAVQNLDRCK